MANWFCSVFNVVMCRKRLSSQRCRSELIDSAWWSAWRGGRSEEVVGPERWSVRRGGRSGEVVGPERWSVRRGGRY